MRHLKLGLLGWEYFFRLKKIFLLLFFLHFISFEAYSQETINSGIWLGNNLKIALNKKFDFNFNQQIREIISPLQIGTLQLETGIDYALKKHLIASAFYRFDLKPDIYAAAIIQHRLYFDLGINHKFKKKMTVDFRIRFQQQFQRIKLPNKYLRPKLTLKYKMTKKISFYTDGELFYNIYYLGNQFDNLRLETGMSWGWKHGLSWDFNYLLDKSFNVSPSGFQHIIGINFNEKF